MTRPTPIIAGIVAAFVLLFAAYMGSYYALLEEMAVGAQYRVDSPVVAIVYWPANRLDHLIRPRFWGQE